MGKLQSNKLSLGLKLVILGPEPASAGARHTFRRRRHQGAYRQRNLERLMLLLLE